LFPIVSARVRAFETLDQGQAQEAADLGGVQELTVHMKRAKDKVKMGD
jgi:hypothetical protein